jgi:hypothetical protein
MAKNWRALPYLGTDLTMHVLFLPVSWMSQIEHSEIDVRLKRLDRVYRPGVRDGKTLHVISSHEALVPAVTGDYPA